MDATTCIKFVEAMERAVMSGDKAAAVQYLTENVHYIVGARPALHGIDAVVSYIAEQNRIARWEGHTLRAAWMNDGVFVVEVESHFTRIADKRPISFPCLDIYRFKDGRIYDWRVYADMSPLYGR